MLGIGELVALPSKGLMMKAGFDSSMENVKKEFVEKALRLEAGDDDAEYDEEEDENREAQMKDF